MPKSSKTPGLGRREPPREVLFGTPEEISARDRGPWPGRSVFQQVPADLRGKNANAELSRPKGSTLRNGDGV